MSMITIEEAGEMFAEQTGRPSTRNTFRHILMAGAESRLRIYWRNSEQRYSRLFGFAGEVPKSSEAIREMEVPSRALGQLETRPAISISIFEPTHNDWTRLQELNSLDEDGDPGGFRAHEDGEARVTLEKLLVREAELGELAEALLRAPVSATRLGTLKPHQRTFRSGFQRWSVRKPERFRAYTLALYESLQEAHRTGRPVPTAREILEEWRAAPPEDLLAVMSDGVKYYDSKRAVVVANVKAISVAICRLVKLS
jgi:hypothetical protein